MPNKVGLSHALKPVIPQHKRVLLGVMFHLLPQATIFFIGS